MRFAVPLSGDGREAVGIMTKSGPMRKDVDTSDTGEATGDSGGDRTDAQGAAPGTRATTEAAFDRVKAQLKARLGADVFMSWFGRMKLAEASRSVVRLSVPTAFLRSWINNHYLDLITELWRAELPGLLKVEIVVRTAVRSVRPSGDVETPARTKPQATRAPMEKIADNHNARPAGLETRSAFLGSPLDPRYTFASFVEGASNRVAFSAARAVAEQATNAARFNPLVIHASVGLGKTHLLQAIAAGALARNAAQNVVYLTAEYFMWRFASAIRDNTALSFKERLREIDLLVIDDMQFLQGKSIQNEFCHLINLLLDSARQVVVAADRPPSELESLDPRIRSRLQGGVALEMSAPDFAMRLAILQDRLALAKATDPTVALGDDILEHIAGTITGSGRELEGALNQVIFRQSFEPAITLDRVDEMIGHLCRAGETRKVRIEDIQKVVARHYNVSKVELLSDRRTRTIVKPRQIAMYLSKVLTLRSLPEIGRRFGGRDHTTVLHAVRKIETQAESDDGLAREIELLKRLIADQA